MRTYTEADVAAVRSALIAEHREQVAWLTERLADYALANRSLVERIREIETAKPVED